MNIYTTALETMSAPPIGTHDAAIYAEALTVAFKLDSLRERGVAAAKEVARQMTNVAEAFANGTPPTSQTLQLSLEVVTLATEFNTAMQAWIPLLTLALGKAGARRVRDCAVELSEAK